MKKNILLFLLIYSGQLLAQKTDVSSTYHKKGVFKSQSSILIHAPVQEVDKTVDKLVKNAIEDPGSLEEWALKGLGKSSDGKDNFLISFKGHEYDEKTGNLRVYLDFTFVGLKKMEDIPIDCNVKTTLYNNGNKETKLIVYYTNFVLKEAWGSLTTERINDKSTRMYLHTHIKFGWFFNIFFTMKNYRQAADWRIEGFLENLKTDAESRVNN